MPAWSFSKALLRWHAIHGRHDLPWQQNRNAYRVWLSEIMLQQTQVATVIPYFNAFCEKLPTLDHLAKAPSETVMRLWAGLGYYSRARNLHKSAQICQANYAGQLPVNFDELLKLPGIGRSTAGAILSQAHGQKYAILDGNVKRVLTRFHALSGDINSSDTLKKLWAFAETHLPETKLADYSQAIMDLGATLCTRSKPKCESCPMELHCTAFKENTVLEFPHKKIRATKATREIVLLVVQNLQKQFLLEKRPNTGIWGGLYSLPEAENIEQAVHMVQRFMKKTGKPTALNTIRHQFSHFELRAQPIYWQNCAHALQIKDNNQSVWLDTRQLEAVGLPAPIKKLLQSLK